MRPNLSRTLDGDYLRSVGKKAVSMFTSRLETTGFINFRFSLTVFSFHWFWNLKLDWFFCFSADPMQHPHFSAYRWSVSQFLIVCCSAPSHLAGLFASSQWKLNKTKWKSADESLMEVTESYQKSKKRRKRDWNKEDLRNLHCEPTLNSTSDSAMPEYVWFSTVR